MGDTKVGVERRVNHAGDPRCPVNMKILVPRFELDGLILLKISRFLSVAGE